MIDSHCHLYLIDKKNSPAPIVEDARRAGVDTIIDIGVDITTSRTVVKHAGEFERVYAAVGIHPHDASKLNDDSVAQLRALAANPKVVAIGETGLDYYRDLSPRPVQKKAFVQQLELAVELKKPVVIHTRESFEDTYSIIKEYARALPGGVFHCFLGSVEDAHKVFELGFVISVGGVITYKNAGMAEVARQAPLDKLLLETDAPYLTPVPFRGKPNLPSHVKLVYEKLAELKQLPVVEVEKTIDRTCRKLFKLVELFGD